jgi:ABC-2 type transport system ATP-binding protein
LDEPTNGLDPQGRDEMLDLINDVKARGVSVVLSSHILYDVERVCESVIMLDQGELIHCGPIDALKADKGERVIEIQTKEDDERFRQALISRGFDVEREGFRLLVRLGADADPLAILDVALEEGIQVRHFMPGELTLEKAFLTLLDEHNEAATA